MTQLSQFFGALHAHKKWDFIDWVLAICELREIGSNFLIFLNLLVGMKLWEKSSFLPQAKKFNSARRYRADHSKCKILQNQILSGSNVVTASWPLYDFSILLIIWSSWETKLFFLFCFWKLLLSVGYVLR